MMCGSGSKSDKIKTIAETPRGGSVGVIRRNDRNILHLQDFSYG
jgi:hypothetical protein